MPRAKRGKTTIARGRIDANISLFFGVSNIRFTGTQGDPFRLTPCHRARRSSTLAPQYRSIGHRAGCRLRYRFLAAASLKRAYRATSSFNRTPPSHIRAFWRAASSDNQKNLQVWGANRHDTFASRRAIRTALGTRAASFIASIDGVANFARNPAAVTPRGAPPPPPHGKYNGSPRGEFSSFHS